MKYKDKLSKLDTHRLFLVIRETEIRANKFSIIGMWLCAAYWIFHDSFFNYFFVGAAGVFLSFTLISSIRLELAEKEYKKKANDAEIQREELFKEIAKAGRIIDEALEKEEGGDQ